MAEVKKIIEIRLREKIILLLLQVMLPFVLFFAINLDSLPLGLGAGILLVITMLTLVLFG